MQARLPRHAVVRTAFVAQLLLIGYPVLNGRNAASHLPHVPRSIDN